MNSLNRLVEGSSPSGVTTKKIRFCLIFFVVLNLKTE